jgi:hypothetical protein
MRAREGFRPLAGEGKREGMYFMQPKKLLGPRVGNLYAVMCSILR